MYLNIIAMMSCLSRTTDFRTSPLYHEKEESNADPNNQYSEGEVKVFQSEFFQLLG